MAISSHSAPPGFLSVPNYNKPGWFSHIHLSHYNPCQLHQPLPHPPPPPPPIATWQNKTNVKRQQQTKALFHHINVEQDIMVGQVWCDLLQRCMNK